MGHDITAYLYTKVAYLRRNAGNPDARRIYKALDCQYADGGCSGLGHYLEFTFAQLLAALEMCKENNWKEEVEFLEKTYLAYKNASKDQCIIIYFG